MLMIDSPDYLTRVKGLTGIRNLVDLDQMDNDSEYKILADILSNGLVPKLIRFINQS